MPVKGSGFAQPAALDSDNQRFISGAFVDITLLVKAAIMGVVEGLTEFLPISSTGHLILAGAMLGFDDDKAKVFDIAIQTGAIFAVILVYWQKIRDTLLALPTDRQARQFALNVLIAFVPAVILGLLFGKAIKANLFTPVVVASTFIIGGMLLGLSRKAATDFSFFLAMPTLIGAGAYSLYKERALLSLADVPMFAVGLLFSFISAWLCIRWLLRYISSHSFVPFAWYRITFGLVVLATAWSGLVTWAA